MSGVALDLPVGSTQRRPFLRLLSAVLVGDVTITFSVLGRTSSQRFTFQPDSATSDFGRATPAC